MVKEIRTSTCTLIIVVEKGLDRITVKVNEHLTRLGGVVPQHVTESLIETGHSLEDAEAYACELLEASLKDGFVRAL